MKKISFVVPVCNEEKGFMKFYDSLLLPELKKLKYDYELILVDQYLNLWGGSHFWKIGELFYFGSFEKLFFVLQGQQEIS